MKSKFVLIKEKAEKAGLQTEIKKYSLEFNDEEIPQTELVIHMPCERDFKIITLDKEHQNLHEILKSDFEKFKFIAGYEAIYSSDLKIIEASIQSDDIFRTSSLYLRRLIRYLSYKIDQNQDQEINLKQDQIIEEVQERRNNLSLEIPSPFNRTKIYIKESSVEFSFLSGNKVNNHYSLSKLKKVPVIRMEGFSCNTHNQAKEIMQRIANSILFQIDLLTNIPSYLSPDSELKHEFRGRRKSARTELKIIEPKYQYDEDAISLYWYARSAVNTPLLQYLAFYQVIEYYFPIYFAREARDRIKNLLKDPVFDSNSDKSVTKIIEIAKTTLKGREYSDERSQLKATIIYCADHSSLMEFFNENEERKSFFDESKKGKSLVKQKLNFAQKDYDLRNDVINRIYDLRCRIVHTKEEAEIPLLLPNSTDIILIKYDIDLIEFLARKVLIAGCKPLDIKM